MSNGRKPSAATPFIPPGVALMPEDFSGRLTALKQMTGLTWEGMAVGMGVDPRQLLRWREHGGEPNGGAMLALVRLAIRVPEGLGELLDEDVIVIFKTRRRDYDD